LPPAHLRNGSGAVRLVGLGEFFIRVSYMIVCSLASCLGVRAGGVVGGVGCVGRVERVEGVLCFVDEFAWWNVPVGCGCFGGVFCGVVCVGG
jgi:hypothetical protein